MSAGMDLQRVAELLFQFGPFAFSIVFVFLLSRQCNSQYQKSVTRSAPPATQGELWMYRTFFIVAFLIGCGLAIYSVYWWTKAQDRSFVYDFRIIGVQNSKKLQAIDPVILKSRPQEQGDGTLLYDFVVINSGPFRPGQKFTVVLAEDRTGAAGGLGVPNSPLVVVWNGLPQQRFQVTEEGGKAVLESAD